MYIYIKYSYVLMAILTITSIDPFGELVLLIPETISSVGLEVLLPRGRTLPPEDTIRIPIIICYVVILGLLMPVDHQAKEIVT